VGRRRENSKETGAAWQDKFGERRDPCLFGSSYSFQNLILYFSVMTNPTSDSTRLYTATPSESKPPLAEDQIEVSVVIPCLNEAETVERCVQKAWEGLRQSGAIGEVIVADNGSTDGSRELARGAGATVVPVPQRGYGSALMGGIAAARGRYVIMGDADAQIDFHEIPLFVHKLRQGYDVVQGCRLPAGGGRIMPGGMKTLHRYIGNPMFSGLARLWFGAKMTDVYCGYRAFRKSFQQELNQRCTGMEFATEMIIKASLRSASIAEVPVTLYPDGRKAHGPHLRTFRDGWRTLRFYLMFSPRWLFLVPGALLILVGIVGYALALPAVPVGRGTFDVHTLLFASLAIICGVQSVLFAVFAKIFAVGEGLLPEDPRLTRLYRVITLEKGLLLGAVAMVIGLACLVGVVVYWGRIDFAPLDYPTTLRWVIPGVTLTALGFQAILSSFLMSILGMRRK
jgi:glycosyltransferase involved in cell wall biosynthesis